MAKINIDSIREECQSNGWKLLSEEYKNLDTEMIFECTEGHKVNLPWKKLRGKLECPICKANIYKDHTEKVVPKPRGATRVLALDQATKVSGYSIYDDGKLVTFGTFSATQESPIEKIQAVRNWLINMIHAWKPDYVGIEGIQLQENKDARMGVTTFEALARLQGCLMLTCHDLGIPFEVCPTNTWRAHCKVKGQSRTDKKRSMQLLTKKWFDVTVSEDEADAIGIGKYMAEVIVRNTQIFNWE